MDEELKVLFCRLYLLDMLVEIMVLAEESEQHFFVALVKPSDAKRAISIIRTTIHKLLKKKSAHWHGGKYLIPPEAKASLDRLRTLASFLESNVENPLNLASSHLRNRQSSPSAIQTVVEAAHVAFEKFRFDLGELRDTELVQVKLLVRPPAPEHPDVTSPLPEHPPQPPKSKPERRQLAIWAVPLCLAIVAGTFPLVNSYYQHRLLSNTTENSIVLEFKRRLEVIRAQCLNFGNPQSVIHASARLLSATRGGAHYNGPSSGLGQHELGEIVSELGARGRSKNLDDALHAAEDLLSVVSTNVSMSDSNKIWSSLQVLDSFSITNQLFPGATP